MKQLLFLSILCCLISPLSHAQTFSGTVTDARTGQVVPGIYVFLQDSLATMPLKSTTTNALGAYSISASGTPVLGRSFRLYPGTACGVLRPNQFVRYTGTNPMVVNLSVCQGATSYRLQGNVSTGAVSSTGYAMLDLFSVGLDSIGNDTVVKHVRRFVTMPGTNGAFAEPFQFIPEGRLYLKASLDSSHPGYGAFLPTYLRSAQSWQTATVLTNAAFISDTSSITMIDTVRPSGPGCISGWARSTTGQGLWGRIIILTNGSNAAAGFTITDAQGHFEFTNLALGTYKVHGDVIPKLNPALTMTLTGTRPCISSILFEESNTMFAARLMALGVASGNGSILDELLPVPNPAQGLFRLQGSEKISGPKQVTVLDISGRIIAREEYTAGSGVALNAQLWPAGTYFIRLQTSLGVQTYRVSKI